MTLRDEPVLNLFYRFAPACWGEGVATEAATEVVRWAAPLGEPVVARVRLALHPDLSPHPPAATGAIAPAEGALCAAVTAILGG